MAKGSLTVCGTGTTSVAQVTLETVGHIRDAQRVFYLASDPLTERWIRRQRPDAESLQTSYRVAKLRRDTYAEMVERLLAPCRAGLRVCALYYGHPGVAVYAGHEAVRQALNEGCDARMLPGISAEACLYADLGVDPVARGCVSREATDFVLCERPADPTLDLILWQAGLIGHLDYQEVFGTQGLPILVERLLETYPPDHVVTIYEAPNFAVARPRIDHVGVAELARADVRSLSTLYVPASVTLLHDAERSARLAALCGRTVDVQ
jgi:siroheme synthase